MGAALAQGALVDEADPAEQGEGGFVVLRDIHPYSKQTVLLEGRLERGVESCRPVAPVPQVGAPR